MNIQIRGKQNTLHSNLRKEVSFKNQQVTKQLMYRSTFSTVQKCIQENKQIFILFLADKLRRQQADFQMSCKQKYWLIQYTLNCKNQQLKQSLFKLLLALKIKLNYLYELAKQVWNNTQIIEFISFYSSNETIINLRSPEFIQLLVAKSLQNHQQFDQDYINTLVQLQDYLLQKQKLSLIPFINKCLSSTRVFNKLNSLKLLLQIVQLDNFNKDSLLQLSQFPYIIQLASKQIPSQISFYSFQILKNILLKQNQQVLSLIDQNLMKCLEQRIKQQDQTINQQTEEVISILTQYEIQQALLLKIFKQLFHRFNKYQNQRIKEHITKTLNNLIVLGRIQILQGLHKQDKQTFSILIWGLTSMTTNLILETLDAILIIVKQDITYIKNQLFIFNISDVITQLLDYPASDIFEKADELLKLLQ